MTTAGATTTTTTNELLFGFAEATQIEVDPATHEPYALSFGQ